MAWPIPNPFGRRTELTIGDDPVASLRREIDRAFETFGRELGWSREEGKALAPTIDVVESDEALEITAELPGVEQKDVDITISDNVLTIKGEKRLERDEAGKNYHVVERSHGAFVRSLTLPFEADPEQAKAKFGEGVLTITLPKPPEIEARAKKIAIEP